jgi:hypothetical protein
VNWYSLRLSSNSGIKLLMLPMSAPEKLTALKRASSNACSLAASSEETIVATPVTSYQDAAARNGVINMKVIDIRLKNIFFIVCNRSGINIALPISVKFGGFFLVRQTEEKQRLFQDHASS